MNIGLFEKKTRRGFGFLTLFCILALAPRQTIASESDVQKTLNQCCTTHSYGGSDPRSLSLRSPIGIQMFSFDAANRVDPAPSYIEDIIKTFGSVTGKVIYLNKSKEWMERASTGIYIVLLPENRSDLSDTDIFTLRAKFGVIKNAITNPQGERGIDGILDVMYSSDKNELYSYRLKSGAVVDDVFAVVRPNSQGNTPGSLKRAVLESLGYNADNIKMSGTIFDGSADANLTSKDIEAIRYLNQK